MHRIAAQRFNVNVPLAACVIAVGRQAWLCWGLCVCSKEEMFLLLSVPALPKSGICLCGRAQLRNSQQESCPGWNRGISVSWCVCVSLSAVEQDGKWGWRVALLRQPRVVLGAASQGRAGLWDELCTHCPGQELGLHAQSLGAGAVGLPNGKSRQDWSQSASFGIVFGVSPLAFGGGPGIAG